MIAVTVADRAIKARNHKEARMKTFKITPVILAGGTGTRLWPLSRTEMPKQFFKVNGASSLFQDTLARMNRNGLYAAPVVVTRSGYRSLAEQQAKEIGIALKTVICEEEGRNTGPAIALAAAIPSIADDNTLMLVLPSDHAIGDEAAFASTIEMAAELCGASDHIVTLGITPTAPETGYGYIKRGKELGGLGHQIDRFVEKPARGMAELMLSDGGYLWNAGIFMARRSRFRKEIKRFAPGIMWAAENAATAGTWDGIGFTPAAEIYSRAPSIAFDHAVMEHTRHASVITADPVWSDLGSFAALHDHGKADHDDAGNLFTGDVVSHDSAGCYAISTGRLLTLAGVEDLAVVATDDAVLVTSLENSQSVKEIVSQLDEHERAETRAHTGEDRPWGRFDSLHKGDAHQVKTIKVKPGGQLSLQYHHHRAEHWIVVAGTPTVTVGTETRAYKAGEHVYIPKGDVHRLENLSEEMIEIIEVQIGDYLGEDDIVRLDDVYGRGKAVTEKAEAA